VDKVEKRISISYHHWLSRGDTLVLVKVVLEAVLVYRMSLSWILKGVLENLRRISFILIYFGCQEKI
jgi:hypothetical protein